MNRRTILLGSSALGVLALTGCALTQSQLQNDVQLLTSGLGVLIANLRLLPQVPPNILDQAQTEVDIVTANANQIGSAAVSGTSVYTIFSTGVGVLAALVTPFFPASPVVEAIVMSVAALARSILVESGVVSATSGLPPARMSAPQARGILRALSATPAGGPSVDG